MKKHTFLVSLLTLMIMTRVQAQGGIFSQNKTQMQYLLQQIAAAKVYGEYLRKGYGIAKTGLNAIGSFTDGEFSLHKLFFSSLRTVSPQIRKYPKIAEIIQMQVSILSTSANCKRKIKNASVFQPEEAAYVSQVFDRLLSAADLAISELIEVLRDGGLQMKDDERIRRIDDLHEQVLDMYLFSQNFSTETYQLGATRSHEQHEIEEFKKW